MNQDRQPNSPDTSAGRIRFRLSGTSHSYDARTSAIRPDLADIALAQDHFAPHYAAPVPLACVATSAPLRADPRPDAGMTSELLRGEGFHVLDVRGAWAWGYCAHDHYVGYVARDALGLPAAPTHRARQRTAIYAAPERRAAVTGILPPGSLLAGEAGDAFLAVAGGGYVTLNHIDPVARQAQDWVAVASQYLGQPYVWGGRGGLGLDCSGLVQMALMACGLPCPRDSDQQEAVLGRDIADDDPLRRGDILFFPGHVGLMMDGETLLHASGKAMTVLAEPLAEVTARFAADHARPVTARRRIAP